MTIGSCAIAFAFSLLATAVSAEPPPPASGNRPDPALEAFVAQVGVDLAQKAVPADLAASPRVRLPEIQGCASPGDFDPDKVTDNSTYKMGEQGLPTTGIPYVIVSGQQVVKNGEFQKVWAGQPIRFPVEEKGRFVPASVEEWIETYSIHVTDCPASPDSPYHNH